SAGGLTIQPEKVLHDLCRLDGQAHGQVLGTVKGLPGPKGGESPHRLLQLSQRRAAVCHMAAPPKSARGGLPPFAPLRWPINRACLPIQWKGGTITAPHAVSSAMAPDHNGS